MSTKTDNYKAILITSALMALGTVLRFYQLDRTLGEGDEYSYILEFGDSTLKYIATTYNFGGGHAVFHTLLMRLMIMVFGNENAIAVRFPAFLPGVVCLWLIYRVALLLFNSLPIARLSLLIAAICPIHIYYSQAARGYSLMMFLSIATLYAALKMLDSLAIKWGVIFVLCGALSVYTVITNVYFIIALATWLFAMLLLPQWREEFGTVASRKKAFTFLSLFLLMALLTYLVYLPLLSQVIETMGYHLDHEREVSKLVIAGRVSTGTLLAIFPGLLIWFLPFLVVGVLFGNTTRRSYRQLPLCIFFLPLIIPMLSGVGGFPRNYLYNLPTLVIFLAAGMMKTGDYLSMRLPMRYAGKLFCFAIVSLYIIASSKILITEHYPFLKRADGRIYQQQVSENSDLLDLIVIADTKNYFYARTIFQQNLKNIFLLNKLSGIKMITSSYSEVENTVFNDGHSTFPLFKGFFKFNNPRFRDLGEGRKLIPLSTGKPISIAHEDIETAKPWAPLSGSGWISSESKEKLFGANALLLEATSGGPFLVETVIAEKVNIEKPSLLVFLWCGKVLKKPENSIAGSVIPLLVFFDKKQGNEGSVLRLGKVNDGMITTMPGIQPNNKTDDWLVEAFIGAIMPGEYAMNLRLAVPPGYSIVYDGLRIFIADAATAG